MTRLLREHPAIDAELDAGGPAGRDPLERHREPVEVCNRWRVEESWWREPIARDYFKVVGAAGWRSCTWTGSAGTWHLERLYD